MLIKNNIKKIIIHCSDTNDSNDVSAKDIHEMHLGFGWDGIGYHKVIKRNGIVENGRPEYWVGAHAKGLNKESLGVCLIGKSYFTKDQFYSLEIVLKSWTLKYKNAVILGHCEAMKTDKTCPNFNVQDWVKKRNIL
jgi:N-acetylmuramoyl-L-alanine amidase